jgi:hypothetical protein
MAKGSKPLLNVNLTALIKELVGSVAKGNQGDDSAAASKSDAVPLKAAAKAPAVAGWRPCKSILKLREQINEMAPHRSKASDGIIGDTNHKKTDSDHNPWVIDGAMGVVTAIDITHDPGRGCDAGLLARTLIESKDKRIKYVIWNSQIANHLPMSGEPAWAWRPYAGKNPHDKHVHVSVRSDKASYDGEQAWKIATPKAAKTILDVADPFKAKVSPGDAIAWGKRVGPAFKAKAITVANALLMDPNVLMAVMAFETGRQFKSSTVNKSSGATGLIQFMPKTAVSLGTTTAKLAKMSEVDQLDYVEKYLRPYRGKMNDVPSAYMAVLWPAAVAKPLSFVLFAAPTNSYKLNSGLDADDDGKVTKAEAAAKVSQQLVEGMRPENFG